jgi:methionyl-tRNA formyltransferase
MVTAETKDHQPEMYDEPLRIGWIGFHQEGIPALQGLLDSGIVPAAVITLDEASAAKRSAVVSYADVLKDREIPLHYVQNINDASAIDLLRSLRLDLLFVIGWSQILSAETLATARLGAIGAHASLLPANRGSAPINWSLIRGESVTGNTLIWLTAAVDEGQVIDQMSIPITPYDTCATLYENVAQTNHAMIQSLLPRLIAGERPGCVQPHSDQPLLPRRRPDDGRVDWTQSADQIYNFVRALTRPYPGAFSFLDGHKYLIQSCALLPEIGQGSMIKQTPGTIVGAMLSPVTDACGVMVGCGTGYVVLLELETTDGRILKGRELSDRAISEQWSGKIWSHE